MQSSPQFGNNTSNIPKAYVNPRYLDSIKQDYVYNEDQENDNERKVEVGENWENTMSHIKKLASHTTILSSAVLFHYVLGSPNEEQEIMFNLSKVIINTISLYLPKTIKTTYTTIPNLEDR